VTHKTSALTPQTDFFLVDPEWAGPGSKLVDVEGELLIGGIGVARGYLNAPDLTEKVSYSYFIHTAHNKS
jgi:long-subunit acyl-CoA synthetase (AMP-forming)